MLDVINILIWPRMPSVLAAITSQKCPMILCVFIIKEHYNNLYCTSILFCNPKLQMSKYPVFSIQLSSVSLLTSFLLLWNTGYTTYWVCSLVRHGPSKMCNTQWSSKMSWCVVLAVVMCVILPVVMTKTAMYASPSDCIEKSNSVYLLTLIKHLKYFFSTDCREVWV